MGVFESAVEQGSRKRNSFGQVMDRRREKRRPMLRSSCTNLTSHLWELELIPAFGINRIAGDIEKLVGRSVDPNLFFEPDVLIAAWPRLTSLLAPHGCWMLCLWETTGETRHLRLFMPVRLSKVGLPRQLVLQALSNEYTPVGTPLIDRDCAEEACETLLVLLADPGVQMPRILDLTHQRRDSRTLYLLQKAAENLRLENLECSTYSRAALFASKNRDTALEDLLGTKRRRELRRQLRRLEDDGQVTFETAQGEEAVLDAFERFLTLELHGWKGRRGTALYNHKRIAAFSRQIVAHLAERDGCEIFSLLRNGTAVASLIMLGSGGRMVPWKIAFDEAYAACSPGKQIMLQATETLLQRDDFIEADSLAIADHWMMNHLWPDRIEITDLMIALDGSANQRLHKAARAKQRLAGIKASAKALLRR